MKDIVVVANFCGDLSENDNIRFTYLCRELAKNHNVELITSDFSHTQKAHRQAQKYKTSFKVTLLHETGYVKNVSLRRFFSHYMWGKAVSKYLKGRKKPDVIYCAVPSLKGPLAVAKYCEKNNVKFIVDVQDLWPEAFKMVLNIPIVSDVIFAPFNFLSNGIYKRADEIVAVSDSYVNRALSVNKKCKSGNTVYLGTKLETYDLGVKEATPIYKKTGAQVLVGYCGSLATSYDIPNLIYAVRKLCDKGIENVKLVIIGDGTHKAQFEEIAGKYEVDAVFTGSLPYDVMCAQLNECDIVVNPIRHGSAATIINKHGDYAASGLPVINSQESVEYRNLVDEYKMGLNCKNEDAQDMADKLEMLILDKELRLQMGQNARRCATEKFDRSVTYKKIIELIEK